MIHYIIVKFKEDVPWRDLYLEEINRLFQEALQTEGIHRVTLHTSAVNLPNRHDLMIRMTMEREALPVFDQSDIHLRWKTGYTRWIETKTIFDCD